MPDSKSDTNNLLLLEACVFCALQYVVACCVGEAYKNEAPFFSLGCLVFLMLLADPAPSFHLLQLIHFSCRRLLLAPPSTSLAAAGGGGGVSSPSIAYSRR